MKDIIWNQSATEDYHDNIDYLLKKWTEREALFFMDEVESIISLIKKDIVVFKESGFKGIRQCVINKHITLYYIERSNERVELLRFWNNHMNREDLRL